MRARPVTIEQKRNLGLLTCRQRNRRHMPPAKRGQAGDAHSPKTNVTRDRLRITAAAPAANGRPPRLMTGQNDGASPERTKQLAHDAFAGGPQVAGLDDGVSDAADKKRGQLWL